jgi:hypothetical protein
MSRSNHVHMHLLHSLELMSNRILASRIIPAGHVSGKGCVEILLAGGPVGSRQKIARCKLQAKDKEQSGRFRKARFARFTQP